MRPLLLAHRGWRRAGPENSLRSVVEAFRRCDGAEVDVVVTADGVPVVRHDDRLAGGAPVRALTLAQLRAATGQVPDEIPLAGALLEAIGTVPGPEKRLDLELKVPGAARALRPLAGRLERVVFSSFWATEVQDALALFPGVPVGLLLSHPPRFVPQGVGFLSVLHDLLPVVRRAYPDLPLWTWTVNDEAVARRAREAGCAAVIGDDAEALARWMAPA